MQKLLNSKGIIGIIVITKIISAILAIAIAIIVIPFMVRTYKAVEVDGTAVRQEISQRVDAGMANTPTYEEFQCAQEDINQRYQEGYAMFQETWDKLTEKWN